MDINSITKSQKGKGKLCVNGYMYHFECVGKNFLSKCMREREERTLRLGHVFNVQEPSVNKLQPFLKENKTKLRVYLIKK